MSHQTEKPAFGLSVQPTLNPKSSQESGLSIETSGTATPKSTSDPANPYSAFYTHPAARRSLQEQRNGEKIPTIAIDPADLEEALTPPHHSTAHLATPKMSMDGRNKECTMWPSRQTLVAEEKKKRQLQRHCRLYRNLTTKQRLWAKILVALFIVAAAVGLGVGISRAVGGGVWSGNGQTKTIPADKHD